MHIFRTASQSNNTPQMSMLRGNLANKAQDENQNNMLGNSFASRQKSMDRAMAVSQNTEDWLKSIKEGIEAEEGYSRSEAGQAALKEIAELRSMTADRLASLEDKKIDIGTEAAEYQEIVAEREREQMMRNIVDLVKDKDMLKDEVALLEESLSEKDKEAQYEAETDTIQKYIQDRKESSIATSRESYETASDITVQRALHSTGIKPFEITNTATE